MADQTKGGIAWTEQTWNPIRGCSRVSEGCRHCYAETVAHRFSGKGQPYEGLTTADGKWNGVIKTVPEHLMDPLRWKRPRMVFVNSMSDLFHESLPTSAIDDVFRVMLAAPQHTFQVLTKRAVRMAAYMNVAERVPPNVWLGVSVEDQETADTRIPFLLQTPAAVRWVSYEPALGPVDFTPYLNQHGRCPTCGPVSRVDEDGCCVSCGADAISYGLDWIVVGGESGTGAREFDVEWARAVIRQGKRFKRCAVFVKQLGATPKHYAIGDIGTLQLTNRKGGDTNEWPDDLRVREYPVVRG